MPKLISVLLILIFSFSVWANEHGEGHEAPKAEEKKEEGHGEAKAEGEKALAPWVEIESKIQEYSARIKSKQESLQKLLEEKNHLPNNSPQLRENLSEMLKEHAELKHLVEEYEKNVNLLYYRYPERHVKSTRKYDHIEVHSIDEMEKAMGVDGKLSRNLKVMKTQYKNSQEATAVPTPVEEAPAAKKVPGKAKDPSIEEADSIILQK